MTTHLPQPPPGLVVLYEDNHLLAVDKPAGLLSQPATPGDDNLLDRARAWLKDKYDKPGNVFVGLVQRLDRNVSGVILLARTSKAASRLAATFRGRDVDKRYLAVVEGRAPAEAALEDHLLEQDRGVVVDPRGKLARLRFKRLDRSAANSLLEVTLVTGRKHQIRAQLAAFGLPLVGDPRYGSRSHAIGRPALHAATLGITHPVRRTPLLIEAPPPADLLRLIAQRGMAC